MDSFESIELRWFYSGSLPDEIANWFDTLLGEPLAAADARSDFYLQSSSPDVGVKIRQGNLEIKHLQQQFGKIEIDRFGQSQVEQWSKWICHDRSASPTAGKQGWIQVDKVRQQRLYQVEFSDPIQLIPIGTPSKNAAAIELTTLQLRGQTWWTIACEYLGDNISIDRQFLPLVRCLIHKYPLSISIPSVAGGYPQWLMTNTDRLSSSTD
jgi:hypothetical protein